MNQTCSNCKTIISLVEDHTTILRLLTESKFIRYEFGLPKKEELLALEEMINENRAALAMIKDTQNLSLAYLGD